MAFSGDPFQILGLPPGASDAEIKRAYRALAKRYHPDFGRRTGTAAVPRHPGGVRHADDARPAAGHGCASHRRRLHRATGRQLPTPTGLARPERHSGRGVPALLHPEGPARRRGRRGGPPGVRERRSQGAGRRGRPPGPRGLTEPRRAPGLPGAEEAGGAHGTGRAGADGGPGADGSAGAQRPGRPDRPPSAP